MSQDPAKSLALAARLYETRSTVQGFLGAQYAERLQPLREAIRKRAEETGRSILDVTTTAARNATEQGKAVLALYFVAAGLDEIEAQGADGEP